MQRVCSVHPLAGEWTRMMLVVMGATPQVCLYYSQNVAQIERLSDCMQCTDTPMSASQHGSCRIVEVHLIQHPIYN